MDRPINVSVKPYNFKNTDADNDLKSYNEGQSNLLDDISMNFLMGDGQSFDSTSLNSHTDESSSNSSSTKEIDDAEKFHGIVELKDLFREKVEDQTLAHLNAKLIQQFSNSHKSYQKIRKEIVEYLVKIIKKPDDVKLVLKRLEEVPFYSQEMINKENIYNKVSTVTKNKPEIEQKKSTVVSEYIKIVLKILLFFMIIVVIHYIATKSR